MRSNPLSKPAPEWQRRNLMNKYRRISRPREEKNAAEIFRWMSVRSTEYGTGYRIESSAAEPVEPKLIVYLEPEPKINFSINIFCSQFGGC